MATSGCCGGAEKEGGCASGSCVSEVERGDVAAASGCCGGGGGGGEGGGGGGCCGGGTAGAGGGGGDGCGGGGEDGCGGGGCCAGEDRPAGSATAAPAGASAAPRQLPASSSGDMFDAVVRLEETFVAEGEGEGLVQGRRMGLEEGGSMGFAHGLRIASEVGFVRGCCTLWLALARQEHRLGAEQQQQQQRRRQHQGEPSAAAPPAAPLGARGDVGGGAGKGDPSASAQSELVVALLALVDEFPTQNSLSDDIVQRLMKIRSQFKRIASRMGDPHFAKSAQALAGAERSSKQAADDLSF